MISDIAQDETTADMYFCGSFSSVRYFFHFKMFFFFFDFSFMLTCSGVASPGMIRYEASSQSFLKVIKNKYLE